VKLKGTHIVVLGRSPTLGTPIGMLLLAREAMVTFCHSNSEKNLVDIVRSGDVVVAAVNEPRIVRSGWIKPGAVGIDAGYWRGRVGAIALEEVSRSASLIAPVPGGVGPMTIAVLIENTVLAAERRTLIASAQRSVDCACALLTNSYAFPGPPVASGTHTCMDLATRSSARRSLI
jgi:methylenetetrahydrofolate dehydrogenase (NADP+) / methenyltetrahydrofolate cyclohydrolase